LPAPVHHDWRDEQLVDKLRVVEADTKAFFKGHAQRMLLFLGDLTEVLLRKPYLKGFG